MQQTLQLFSSNGTLALRFQMLTYIYIYWCQCKEICKSLKCVILKFKTGFRTHIKIEMFYLFLEWFTKFKTNSVTSSTFLDAFTIQNHMLILQLVVEIPIGFNVWILNFIWSMIRALAFCSMEDKDVKEGVGLCHIHIYKTLTNRRV